MNVFDFSVTAQDGSIVSLADYRGKILLIVNTATACGFTPQYEDLQALYTAHQQEGFEILDFPCNQFANQAPGNDEEIHSFCTGRFGITFPQFAKIDVNGEQAIPLYQWLTANTQFEGFGKKPMGLMMTQMLKKQDKHFSETSSIKWNFTKFLINRDGNIVARYEPTVPVQKIEDKLKELL